MKKTDYFRYTKFLFIIVGALHGWRAFNGWNMVVGPWVIPVWVSWVALVVLGYLAFSAHKFSK